MLYKGGERLAGYLRKNNSFWIICVLTTGKVVYTVVNYDTKEKKDNFSRILKVWKP